MGATKAPTGITISRNGGYYTVDWKCGAKNYNKGQQFEYSINYGGWSALGVGTGARQATVYINPGSYYPSTGATFYALSVRVRGKTKGKSWSAWSGSTYTNYIPNTPTLEAALDDQQTNKCTFTWNVTTESTDGQPFTHVRWETILVEESDVTDGSKLAWNSSSLGWDTGAGPNASSITKIEDTTLLADASYTRWVRVCARGSAGASPWVYAKHVYARPYQAIIEHAEISAAGVEGLTCYARWKADQTASHPIDRTTVQYVIIVPNAGLSCPSGAQWADANVSADTSNTDAVRFSIDDALDKDECLFVRVNTVHDTNVTYSEPKLASVGNLKDPDDLSYQVDNANHTLTSVSVDNNSDVPDSFIAIVYRAGSNPEDELVVGIIPHGASQPLVTPVQCPDWSGESAFSIGAYAAVGTYEANSIGYTVKEKMRSASTIWVGGAVPVAPENVNVVQSPITGTATVTWDWTWEEARFAQLSWTDHDDAWESTNDPEIYSITKPKATKWNISGLELGKKWYIAVRLVSGNPDDENAIYSPWSDMRDIILSSVPNVPSLNLSARVITEGEEITASWDFVSNDGTGQISAEIKDEDDNLIAHTETQKEVVIDTEALGWAQGEIHSLSVRVTSESNRTTDWSNPVSIVIAEALDCSISDTSLEHVHTVENERTYTGDLISFTSDDVVPITESLAVDLDPIQDLSGYDAPWVGGAGKNVCVPLEGTKNGIVKTLNDDGTIAITGKSTANSWSYLDEYYDLPYCGIDVGDTISIYSDVYLAVTAYNGSTSLGNKQSKDGTVATYTIPDNTTRLRILQYPKSVQPVIDEEFNTTAKYWVSKSAFSSWQPYENICPISGHTEVDVVVSPTTDASDGNTYTTALGRTVYGGTLNVVSGVLTVTHGIVDLSSLSWTYASAYSDTGRAVYYATNTPQRNYANSILAPCYAEKYQSAKVQDVLTTTGLIGQSTNNRVWCSTTAQGTTPTGNFVYVLAATQTYQLTPQQILLLLGENNIFSSDNMTITVADSVIDTEILTELPLTVSLSGVNSNVTATLTIERSSDYHMDRPDETQFDGFEGEIVYLTAQNTDEDIIINQEDLIGLMDDGAPYRIYATFKDVYGQSMSDSVDFEVHWEHQAIIPEAEVVIDDENLIAKLTPIAPTGALTGDTCDIYRLSADRPELIVKDAVFGTQYVDPYPAIGEFGGHRFVFKTVNGDYITATNDIAWTDTGIEEGDILDFDRTIIDFDGNQLLLYYNVDVGHQWDKDFQQTKYLGGSVQGDWNAGVSRSGSVSATMITLTDAEQISLMRDLAVYTGICHVRTKDGSSYSADVQVSEDRDHDNYGKLVSFSLTITRVDTENLDGLTYEQWAQEEPDE